jgi:hypothetical protein
VLVSRGSKSRRAINRLPHRTEEQPNGNQDRQSSWRGLGTTIRPKRLGFKPDTELEVIEQPEGMFLKRVEQRPSLVKIDGLWVHRGNAEPGTNWERILEDVREERIESVLKA